MLDVDGWSTPRPGRSTPGKEPVPTVWEAGWAPGPVWTGVENLAPHRAPIPGSSGLYQVAILTVLCQPMILHNIMYKVYISFLFFKCYLHKADP